jgi:ABC-type polysaccharide/polyol phosphate export permease
MKYLKILLNFVLSIFQQRKIMVTLIIRDFESRYLSSFLGLPWAFIQPAMYVFVIWFAFTFGLRGGQTASGGEFAPWLLMGLIPWLYIGQTMIVSSASLTQYAFLIKKTMIPVAMIPIIKIFSGLIVHIILMGLVVILLIIFYGITPTIYWFQFFYYLFALTVLLTGIAWFVASVNVFIKDMAHMVNILVTMLFWATPIIWPFSMLNGNYRYVALLNPFFYITEGYRYTFIEKKWFFEFVEMNIFFWTFTIIIFVLGAFTFRKLKPRFADEL